MIVIYCVLFVTVMLCGLLLRAGLRRDLRDRIVGQLEQARVTGVWLDHRVLAANLLPRMALSRSSPKIVRELRALERMRVVSLDRIVERGHESVVARLICRV